MALLLVRWEALATTGKTGMSNKKNYDMEVTLCIGKFTKHAKGKKTDVKDCRWIQKLHAPRLLTGNFLPNETTQ